MSDAPPGTASSLARARRQRSRLWRWSRHSTLVYPVVHAARRRRGRRLVGVKSDMVIDGFERSGTTFAYFAFLDANGGELAVGHHTHSVAQLRWAARLGVPAIVPVRDPADCAVSAAIRWPEWSLTEILEDYIAFHQRLSSLADRVVIADFDMVTTDFGRVIDEANEQFGTDFVPCVADDDARQRVFAAIDDHTATSFGHVDERAVPRPSADRDDQARALRAKLTQPDLAALVTVGQRLHQCLVES